jgi:hypothetical protein
MMFPFAALPSCPIAGQATAQFIVERASVYSVAQDLPFLVYLGIGLLLEGYLVQTLVYLRKFLHA